VLAVREQPTNGLPNAGLVNRVATREICSRRSSRAEPVSGNDRRGNYTYGPVNDAESTQLLHRAVDLGVTLFDTADIYGFGHNEQLVGRALAPVRDRVIIATKFGIVREPGSDFSGPSPADGRPEYVRAAIDASLSRLGVDHVDLYHQHRADAAVPIEETVGAMAELVTAGKVGHLPGPGHQAGALQPAGAGHAQRHGEQSRRSRSG
jgi:aryl-alcohol dehydrogenase-like predicted oxidoreductase